MTKDDVIRLAQEAGWKDLRNYDSEMHEFLVMGSFKDLEAFAKLVAEHERREFGQVLFDYAGRDDLTLEEESLLKHLYEILRARGQE